MKYFIDTANQNEIDKWKPFVHGVTSNPSLLEKADIDPEMFYMKNRDDFANIFIQVNSLEMVKSLPPSNRIIMKVPLLRTDEYDGFDLLMKLKRGGFRTCSTIVYDIAQFDFACQIGADFSIVLYAKNIDRSFIKKCCELKKYKKYKTQIIGASFRNVHQVLHCIYLGVDYATVPPNIMEEVFKNDNAIEDYFKFYKGD